jgi:hypothetical protein
VVVVVTASSGPHTDKISVTFNFLLTARGAEAASCSASAKVIGRNPATWFIPGG